MQVISKTTTVFEALVAIYHSIQIARFLAVFVKLLLGVWHLHYFIGYFVYIHIIIEIEKV